MEHYKGLWNRAYLHKSSFNGWQTYYGEILSFNGTGETVAIFKLRKLHIKTGMAFLTENGIEKDKTIQLKKRNWIQANPVTIKN
jgi:hypothetical protein